MSNPAGWHPDPHGRWEYRWWDGHRWTDHVASGGRQTREEPGPPPPPAPPHAWHPPAGAPSQTTNAKAVIALVVGLVSWPLAFVPVVGLVVSLIAVFLGVQGRREVAADTRQTGGGLATAGLVLGVISGVLNVLLLVGIVWLFSTGGWDTQIQWERTFDALAAATGRRP